MQDRLLFRRAIGILRSKREADGGMVGPSTGEGIAGIGWRQEPLGDECRHI